MNEETDPITGKKVKSGNGTADTTVANKPAEKAKGEVKMFSLIANDVFGLKAVELNLNGGSAMLIGPNQAGKTSLINALKISMGQIKNGDPRRHGERKGEIIANYGEFTVTRIWKDKGSPRWEVTSEDGQRYGTGQDVFNGFIDEITIQPDKIIGIGGTERARLVCKAVGIDMEKFQADKKSIEDERRGIGRLGKEAESKLDGIGKPGRDVPVTEIKISDLNNELSQLREKQKERDRIETDIEGYDKKITESVNTIKEYERKIIELEKIIADNESYRNRALEQLEKASDYDYQIQSIVEKLAQAETINNQVRARVKYEEAQKDYDKYLNEYKGMTAKIQEMDADLRDKLNNAGLVDGLVVEKEDIYLNNIKFDELSKFQQLDLAMQIGMKIKSHNADGQFAKILCIDASPYDEENWKKIVELAKANGFTVIIEIPRRFRRDAETGKLIIPDDINAIPDIKKFYIEEGYAEEIENN
jgi:hypothetical protein